MRFYPTERTALLVDGADLWISAKAMGFDVDFKALADLFAAKAILARCAYFTPLDDREFTPVKPMVDWMENNGWLVVTKRRGDLDVDLAVAMLEMSETVQHFVLFSSDDDFVPAVEAVQRRGCRVTVVSTVTGCSHELLATADDFISLGELKPDITRVASKQTVPA